MGSQGLYLSMDLSATTTIQKQNIETLLKGSNKTTLLHALKWFLTALLTLYLVPLHLSAGLSNACPAVTNLTEFNFKGSLQFLRLILSMKGINLAWNAILTDTQRILLHSTAILAVLTIFKRKRNLKPISLLKAIIVTFLSTISLHVLAILFGLPPFKNWQLTASWSLFSSVLLFLPLSFQLGLQHKEYQRILLDARLSTYPEFLASNTYTAYLFGSLLGSVVAPLDWQKPWQNFPIPQLIAGLSLAFLISLWCPFLIRIVIRRQLKDEAAAFERAKEAAVDEPTVNEPVVNESNVSETVEESNSARLRTRSRSVAPEEAPKKTATPKTVDSPKPQTPNKRKKGAQPEDRHPSIISIQQPSQRSLRTRSRSAAARKKAVNKE